MRTKYGEVPDSQFEEYRTRLHSMIHWFLVYGDNDDKALPGYFDTVQYRLHGLNSLLGYPEQIIEIMNLLESAKIEYLKPNRDRKRFRRTILDAHEQVDRIGKYD